jgi:hypothetical protein
MKPSSNLKEDLKTRSSEVPIIGEGSIDAQVAHRTKRDQIHHARPSYRATLILQPSFLQIIVRWMKDALRFCHLAPQGGDD